MKNIIYLFVLIVVACSRPGIELKTDHLTMRINNLGQVTDLLDNNGKNYIPDGHLQPLLQIRINGEFLIPDNANQTGDIIQLKYQGRTVSVKSVQKKSHITFELLDYQSPDSIELAVWGPFHTSIDSLIGETVGVVRGPEYAIGMQSLNAKTLGGYPWKENDAMPQMDIFESGDYSDLSEQGKRYVLYRVEAAKPEEFGSSLQAYVRNRFEDRVIENLNHDMYVAPKWDDGGLVGSKIALFGSPVEQALDFIERIELEEGLPHPMIDGEWGKRSRGASAAYLIMGFNEKNYQKCIDYTKQAGLRYLYHDGPFENWGAFELKKNQFPSGWDGLKGIVDAAEAQGVHVGVHTLSNFITTNDPYVTPIPDDRLAVVGSSVLTEDIDGESTEIEVESIDFFNQFRNNHLKTVRIGNELIRYGEVSKEAPWKLLDCQRGAWGTEISSHSSGETVSKLADHGYKVFLSNADLTIEMSKTLADLYNKTGIRQISFDGLEGNRSTGMGNYGETLMPLTWYENLDENIRSHYIADASRTTHFFWHIYSRMNWGEPWYAGFRESQTEYRMKNQVYFRRNMMPGMLGWFLLRPTTSLEDIEWLLAKSAAFNAGYAFVCNFESLEGNGQTDRILELIGQYEKLRMADAFSPSQIQVMENTGNEFHLEYRNEDDWSLYQYHLQRATHTSRQKQPGEPTGTNIQFENPYEEQPLQFILTASENSYVSDIKFEIDNYKTVEIPVNIPSKHHLKYLGGTEIYLFDENWNLVKEIEIDRTELSIGNGSHTIIVDGEFGTGEEHVLKMEVKVWEEINPE